MTEVFGIAGFFGKFAVYMSVSGKNRQSFGLSLRAALCNVRHSPQDYNQLHLLNLSELIVL